MRLFNTKRALSLLVAVCMLVAMLPAGLISASAAEVGTVYSYKFWDAMIAAGATGTGTAFSQSYQASQDANVGSAPWMLYSVSNNYYAAAAANVTYGIFAYSVKGGSDVVTWKINVPEDAKYVASFDFYQYGSSSPVDVYLSPVADGAVANEETLLMQIDKTGTTGDRTVSSLGKMLTAGDYYLIAKQIGGGVTENRYFTHKTFNMEVVGEYDADAAPEVTKVEFDKTYMFLGMDSIEFITPVIIPEEADTGDIVFEWASSDENVAIVDEGLIMPIGPGFATITATAPNGVVGSAYVLVTDKTNFVYDLTKGHKGPSSDVVIPLAEMTYAQTMAGSPFETVSASVGKIPTDPWAFESISAGAQAMITKSFPSATGMRGYQLTTGGAEGRVTVRINVPTGGTYTPSIEYSKGKGYGSATFYLAPADAINPVAADYALGNAVNFDNGGGITDDHVTKFADIELEAGEYLLSANGTYAALFWENFKLSNPNAVESVLFSRDSLNVAVGETASVAVTVLPATAPDKSVTYASDNTDVAIVDEETGAITAIAEGTAVITATSVADSTKADTVTINVGGKVFYYDFMKSNGFGLTPSKGNDKYLKDAVYSSDFKYTKSGSADEVGKDYESYGWKIGPTVNSSDWTWSQSAQALGLFIYLNNASAENGYASINIDVPLAGTYDLISVHSLWTGGTTADYYLAPVGAENPIDAQYKVNANPINHKTDNGTNYTTEAVVGEVSIDAGEYVLTLYSDAASMIFTRGIRLSDAEVNVPVETITLNKSGTISIVDGETVTAAATVLPANASDKTITWTSSNDSIATVVDGVVTPVGAGIATITVTANDGSGVKASFDVMCNMTLKYTYDFYNSMRTQYNTSTRANVAAELNEFGQSYAASIAAGSAPWMFAGSRDSVLGLNSKYEYFDYTNSSHSQGFGVFGMNYGVVGAWNSVMFNVAEDGKYTGMLKISDFPTSNSFDIYIAPVSATDRVAAEYKVGSYNVSGKALNTTEIALDTVSMPAGDYYITFVVTKVNGGTLIGLFDLKLYYSGALAAATGATIEASSENGASIRTTGNQGLRFVSSIAKNADFDKLVEYGTILIPTADLNGNSNNLVFGYSNRTLETDPDTGKVSLKSNNKVAKVPAAMLYNETDDEVSFTAVITNIAVKNYTREISARAYAIYEDANGQQYVVYGDTVVSRSPYTVAQNGLASDSATAEEKAVFQAIVDAVEGNA